MRRAALGVLAALGCALVAVSDLPACSAAPARTVVAPTAGASARPAVTKLLVVVEENHTFDQMKAGMPYAFGLAKRYGYATDYHAVTHPSLPNYLAIAGGSTFGITDDGSPATHRLSGHSVFGQVLSRGRTAATYAESMPVACARYSNRLYAPKHNPWTYFAGERRACLAHDRGMSTFSRATRAGRLPRVGLVVPNLCHDGHDCPLATADRWFRALMARVFAGPDWRSGRLAVVLTGDESTRVLTVVIHPSQRHHVVTTRLTHYSLSRLYDEVAGLPALRNARTAPSMARAFGLPLH
jgi:acid phosphatase